MDHVDTDLDTPPPLRILLVEDDVDLRGSLVEVLEIEGYDVLAVTSGIEAVTAAAQAEFDLMITDIKMPGKDGLDALQEVKSGQPEVAGIVITGYSTEDYALRAAKLHVEEYLKKPFELDPFLAAVDKVAQDKIIHFRQAQKELLTHQSIQHLATSLMAHSLGKERAQIERGLDHWLSRAYPEYQDPREKAILGTLALRAQFQTGDFEFPVTYQGLVPKEFSDAPNNAQPSLGDILDGDELEDGLEPEETTPSLSGSLLNVALLFESGERLADAAHAFHEFLGQATNPADRYLAFFGLGRIARQQQRLEEMEQVLNSGVQEAELLGGATLVEALTEKGILQALSGLSEGQDTLLQAQSLAAKGRMTSSYALATLALEHFYEVTNSKRDQILETLCRPEYLQVATEAGGWLLPLLLSHKEGDQPAKLLPKLVRVCGKSYQRLMLTNTSTEVLAGGVEFLGALNEGAQQAVVDRLTALEMPAVQSQLQAWTARAKKERALSTTVRVFTFSGMRLYRNDDPLELKRKKPLLLFLFLLVKGKPVGEVTIYETFWPGPEAKAQASLRAALSYLRKLLSPQRDSDPFQRVGGTVGLAPDLHVWFDFDEFWELVRRGRSLQSSQPQRTKALFEAAVKLYRGPFLENVYEDWAIRHRDDSSKAYQECLLFLVESSLQTESWEEVLDFSRQGLNRESLSQRLAEAAMQSLIKLGRSPEALVVFEKVADRLQRELDLEPSIEMLRMQQMARLNV
jgi:DNA-binding response OmpR family regulator